MKTAFAVLLVAATVFAQAPTGTPPRPATSHVVAHGEGVVNAQPDQVRVQVGVTTQGATAQEVGAANAKQTAALISELKQQFGTSAEYQTMNYSLYPMYRNQRDGGKPTISGYQANNTVEVKSNDIAIAGKLVDVATKNGANQIQSVNFSLQDEQKVRAQALSKAAVQARANAEALANALGARIGRIVKIEDGEPVRVMPMMRAEMFKTADAVQTPMEPGSVQVRANVTVTAEIVP